jgi:hypothetical protein
MGVAFQTQNDEISFESVGRKQDLVAEYPEFDHKLRLDGPRGMLEDQFVKPPFASHSSFISHLREIACSRPMKTLW